MDKEQRNTISKIHGVCLVYALGVVILAVQSLVTGQALFQYFAFAAAVGGLGIVTFLIARSVRF